MIQISYISVFIFISVLWVIVRVICAIAKKGVDWAYEARLITVYICLVVIARFVYFPLEVVNGRLAYLEFDISRIIPPRINVEPFVYMFYRYSGWLINIIGNITMFIPVGIFWPMCFKKLDRIWKVVLAGFGLSLFIELSQLLFYSRLTDVDDLIMNTAGVTIGAILYFFIRAIVRTLGKHGKKRGKKGMS